jgi:hypothetical protein
MLTFLGLGYRRGFEVVFGNAAEIARRFGKLNKANQKPT